MARFSSGGCDISSFVIGQYQATFRELCIFPFLIGYSGPAGAPVIGQNDGSYMALFFSVSLFRQCTECTR
jgi:hypothetical protein